MAKFMVIGERIHCISPAMREAVSYTHLDVYKRQGSFGRYPDGSAGV